MNLRSLLFSIAVFSTQCQAQTTGFACKSVTIADSTDTSFMNALCLEGCNDTYPFTEYGATVAGFSCPATSDSGCGTAFMSSHVECSCNCVGCPSDNPCVPDAYKESKEKQRDVKKEK